MSGNWNKLGDWLAVSIVAVALAGLLLHFSLKDSWQWLAPAFYALPLPLIAAGLLAVVAWRRWRPRTSAKNGGKQQRGATLVCLAGGLGVLALWWGESWVQRGSEPEGAYDVTVAFWNAGGRSGRHPMKPLIEWIRQNDVDVLAMAEVDGLSADVRRHYRESLPGYEVHRLGNGMALVCRGEARELNRVEMENRSSVHVVECDLEREGDVDFVLRVVVADIGPNPLHPRGDLLEEVSQLAGGETGVTDENASRTVVMGDFNTPYESVHFDAYRRRYLHAWTESGRGYRETWPWFVPVLCIDHLWLSQQLVPVDTRRQNFFESDHSLIMTRAVWVTPVAHLR